MTATLRDITRALTTTSSSGAAVLIPLVNRRSGLHVLFEVRSSSLNSQPGEVCLPGGGIQSGETPFQAVIRETCEELVLSEQDVHILGTLDSTEGPGGRPLWVYVGTLDNYRGAYSPHEVERTFTVPLEWFLSHDPTIYSVGQKSSFPDEFPWERIPGGRAYPWRSRSREVPFYLETSPLIWGVTARVMHHFSQVLKGASEQRTL